MMAGEVLGREQVCSGSAAVGGPGADRFRRQTLRKLRQQIDEAFRDGTAASGHLEEPLFLSVVVVCLTLRLDLG